MNRDDLNTGAEKQLQDDHADLSHLLQSKQLEGQEKRGNLTLQQQHTCENTHTHTHRELIRMAVTSADLTG